MASRSGGWEPNWGMPQCLFILRIDVSCAMLIFRIAVCIAVSSPAFAQDATLRYFVTPDCPTAITDSAAAWAATKCVTPGCDVQAVTKNLYPVVGLSDLTRCAVVIHDGDVSQGETVTVNGRTYTLTAP